MANLNGFDARTVEPAVAIDLEPIPAGKYIAAITESEMKPTKSGSGSYLQLSFTILKGEYKNRVLGARLNLYSPNATVVENARAELSAICHAVGVLTPKDSVELHNLPLIITVKIVKRFDTGDLVNEIIGYAERKVAVHQIQRTFPADDVEKVDTESVCTCKMLPSDYMIDKMQADGYVLMNAFVDRFGLYDLTFHRWDNGDIISVDSAETWRDAICNIYAKFLKSRSTTDGRE